MTVTFTFEVESFEITLESDEPLVVTERGLLITPGQMVRIR